MDAVADLAGGVVGRTLSERDVRDLHARTGGNPFFVHEVARLLLAHGPSGALRVPPGVEEVLRRRVARLGQPCATLLAAAAVAAESAEDRVETDLLAAVSGCADAAVAPLLDEAVAARLLDDDPARPAHHHFRHALIREVLVQGLPGAERARLHARVAAALADRPGASAARLAHHWCRAAGDGAGERAAEWSVRAAREAAAGFGFEAAAAHYARALAEPSVDRIPVLIAYGEVLQLAGDSAAARDALLRAARAAVERGPRHRPRARRARPRRRGGRVRGAALRRRADRPATAGRPGAAGGGGGPAGGGPGPAVAGAGRGPARRGPGPAGRGRGGGRPPRASARRSSARRWPRTATRSPDPTMSRNASAAATRMIELARDTAPGVLQNPRPSCSPTGCCWSPGSSRATWRQPRCRRWPTSGWRTGERRALPVAARDLARHAGPARRRPGPRLHHAAVADEIGRAADSGNARLMAFTVRLQAHLDRGTPERCTDEIHEVLATLGPSGMPAMYYAGPARVLLAAGETGHARAVLRAFLSGTPAAMPRDAEWLECHWAMGDIAVALDDRAAAAGLFAVLRPYEDLWAVDGIGGAVFGTVTEQLGRLAAHLDRPDADGFLRAARETVPPAGPARAGRAGRRGPDRDPLRPTRPRRPPDGCTATAASGCSNGAGGAARCPTRRACATSRSCSRGRGARCRCSTSSRPRAARPPPPRGPTSDRSSTTRRGRRTGAGSASWTTRSRRRSPTPTSAVCERLRTERSLLADELAGALGLGGRARIAGDPTERARKAVTMRIRAAIATIAAHDEPLARHLRNAVKTGRVCSYDPESPVTWHG